MDLEGFLKLLDKLTDRGSSELCKLLFGGGVAIFFKNLFFSGGIKGKLGMFLKFFGGCLRIGAGCEEFVVVRVANVI